MTVWKKAIQNMLAIVNYALEQFIVCSTAINNNISRPKGLTAILCSITLTHVISVGETYKGCCRNVTLHSDCP